MVPPPRTVLPASLISRFLRAITAFVLTSATGCGPSSSGPSPAPTSTSAPAAPDALLFLDAVHDSSSCPTQRIFRCRTVTVNYDVLDTSIAAGLGSTIKINPFDDTVLDAVLTFSEIDTHVSPVRKTWFGKVGSHQCDVGFTYTAQRQSLVGTISCAWTYPKNYFAISRLPAGVGQHLVLETDPRNPPVD
jgi:hypothetical protein